MASIRWEENQRRGSYYPRTNERPRIVFCAALNPGAYTAIVRGRIVGPHCLVESTTLSTGRSRLGNLSTVALSRPEITRSAASLLPDLGPLAALWCGSRNCPS